MTTVEPANEKSLEIAPQLQDPDTKSARRRTLTVADIMNVNLLQCGPETPVCEAARMMARERKSSILVIEGGLPAGIWTEHDALRLDWADPEAVDTPISGVMSAPVRTVDADKDISEVAALLKIHHMRHYVVVDSAGKARGVVTQSDVVLNHGVEWFMRLHTVESVIARPTTRVQWDEPVSSVAQTMHAFGVDSVIIDHPDHGLGIVTERDIVRHIASGNFDCPAWDLASSPLRTVTAHESLFHARNLMVAHEHRHLGVVDPGGGLLGLIGFRDILATIEQNYVEELELALAERDSALRASEERYRILVELSPDAILVVEGQRIRYINPAGARMLGGTLKTDVTDRDFSEFLDPEHGLAMRARLARIRQAAHTHDQSYREESVRRMDGSTLEVELLASEITYCDSAALQIVMRDISDRKKLERELHVLARTDSLTGAANRMHFEPHLDQAVRESDRHGYTFSLIMLDLDHFKQVNDNHGHHAGDRVLHEMACAVLGDLRESDIFCRWGGEEFLVLTASTSLAEAGILAERIRLSIRQLDVDIGRPITASLAVATYQPKEGKEHFLHRLDIALYQAKDAGRDCVVRAPDDYEAEEPLPPEPGVRAGRTQGPRPAE